MASVILLILALLFQGLLFVSARKDFFSEAMTLYLSYALVLVLVLSFFSLPFFMFKTWRKYSDSSFGINVLILLKAYARILAWIAIVVGDMKR